MHALLTLPVAPLQAMPTTVATAAAAALLVTAIAAAAAAAAEGSLAAGNLTAAHPLGMFCAPDQYFLSVLACVARMHLARFVLQAFM
jgi:hypothetical protein